MRCTVAASTMPQCPATMVIARVCSSVGGKGKGKGSGRGRFRKTVPSEAVQGLRASLIGDRQTPYLVRINLPSDVRRRR